MTIENFSSFATTLGGGFFAGILVGYALKKVIKIAAVILGLSLAALTYLQYYQIATVNWDKLQEASSAVITFANIIIQIPSIGRNENTTSDLALSNFGIPLTGSTAMGFAIGFMKG